MKKIFLSLMVVALIALAIPEKAKAQQYLQYPWGAATYTASGLTSAITADTITVTNSLTFLKYTVARAANLALNVYIDTGVKRGALLIVQSTSDGTARDMTFGFGIDGPTMTGTISKTKVATFFYNGTTFIALSVGVQTD